MAAGKEIKSRIKTVKNTGKITKAMELISTVKMKKAQENVLQLRSFAMAALSILKTISSDENIFKKYTIAPNTQKELIVVIASQKGLCGGYNVNTFKKVMEYLRREGGGYARDNDFVVIGKRARDFILRMNQNMIADYSDEIKDPATISEARSVVRFLLDAWNSGKYSKISIVYNHYVSAISQLPVVKPIFPFQEKEITDFLNRISGDETQKDSHENIDFIIEPNPETILDCVVPMILDAMVYETILEARASEHAARMVAMKNAKDAASKKAGALTLIYNKARQSAITTEITEIVSGVESMKE